MKNKKEGKAEKLSIQDIRSKHLGKEISIKGVIEQASDVRPVVKSARFECLGCKSKIKVVQIDRIFREPVKCSCGRQGGFNLLIKDMEDAQRIIVAGEKFGKSKVKISVFLRDALTDSSMKILESIGKKAEITGKLVEVPVRTSDGCHFL